MPITTTAITIKEPILREIDFYDIPINLICKDNGKEILNQDFGTSLRKGESLDKQIALVKPAMQSAINNLLTTRTLSDSISKDAVINASISKLKSALVITVKEGVE